MESMTLKVPAVVEFSFKDYTIDRVKNKQAASCLHCKAKICEKLGTSSNWKTKHPDRNSPQQLRTEGLWVSSSPKPVTSLHSGAPQQMSASYCSLEDKGHPAEAQGAL
ncbi:UNVERIFIED_CONTAM: hypothetical protein FKN15_050334 [Acipenser sinensis]